MPDGEPALLGDLPVTGGADDRDTVKTAHSEVEADVRAPIPSRARRSSQPSPLPGRASSAAVAGDTVVVAGFWRRFAAGLIDLGIIVPVAAVVTLIAGALIGVSPPRDFQLLLDFVLATDPALVMAFGLAIAVGAIYTLLFQITAGRTLGMRVMGLRVIDVWGERPSPARCLARTAGYVLGVATLFLGYLWIAFDGEKRGLHDWLAGTYVIHG